MCPPHAAALRGVQPSMSASSTLVPASNRTFERNHKQLIHSGFYQELFSWNYRIFFVSQYCLKFYRMFGGRVVGKLWV